MMWEALLKDFVISDTVSQTFFFSKIPFSLHSFEDDAVHAYDYRRKAF